MRLWRDVCLSALHSSILLSHFTIRLQARELLAILCVGDRFYNPLTILICLCSMLRLLCLSHHDVYSLGNPVGLFKVALQSLMMLYSASKDWPVEWMDESMTCCVLGDTCTEWHCQQLQDQGWSIPGAR